MEGQVGRKEGRACDLDEPCRLMQRELTGFMARKGAIRRCLDFSNFFHVLMEMLLGSMLLPTNWKGEILEGEGG